MLPVPSSGHPVRHLFQHFSNNRKLAARLGFTPSICQTECLDNLHTKLGKHAAELGAPHQRAGQ